MEKQEKLGINKPKNLILTGICRCGKTYTTALQLPETITVRSGSSIFNVKLGEHIVIACPSCGRILNMGNGKRRTKKLRML